jgi:Tol biopolymer transport system component
MIGKILGHYKILEKLGSGGMGDVYRAHDTKLGRDVALKVLPSEAADDPERRKRFEREARAIASLKHPNIVTIHSVEEVEGTHFLTMELVEGATLSSLIPKDGMPLERFLEYSVSMADGMSRAHEQGITHRDLKPANVMLDADGHIKILDFGLAKLLQPETDPHADKTRMDGDTAEGVVMGTVAYMSPEQAQGEVLDQRSDIFSLGVLFYEMLTGARPFDGDNKISTISSILRDEPQPVHEVKAALPRHLARIVKRCLAKEPTRRYQTALDLRNDLEELKNEVESGEILATGEMAAVRPPVAMRPKWLVPVVGLGTVAILAAAVMFVMSQQRGAPQATMAPAAAMEMIPITSDGHSSEATISADGRYVAYVTRDERDRQALGYTQVSTGSAVIVVPAQDDVYLFDPVFSPDGDYIYFVRNVAGPEQPALYRVPVLGGSSQKVKEHVSGRPSFSPDGSEYVFLRTTGDGSWLVIAGSGAGERVIAERHPPREFDDPVWSPDGSTIMAGGNDASTGVQGQVVAISLARGEERVVAADPTWTYVGEMSWIPHGSGVVAEIQQNYIHTHVWEVPYGGGKPRRVTNDLNSYHGVEITADGSTVVTQRMLDVTNLWIVREGKPRQLTSVGQGVGASGVRILPDGGFVYHSNQGGKWDIWLRDARGENPRRLTTQGQCAFPSPSPDGSEIAFISDHVGGLEIWKMSVSGGAPTRLTYDGYADEPAWIGDEIVFRARGSRPGTLVLYRMPATGGDAVQVTQVNSWAPMVSPDGTRLMYQAYNAEEDHNQIEIMALATGEVEHVIYLRQWEEAAWSPDGTAIHYSKHVDGQDNVWSHAISAGDDTSGDVMLTDFDDRIDILSIDWSQDGSTLALSRGKTYRDVVLLKGFR